MPNIDIVIVSVHMTMNTVVWQIKRVAPGKPWMGWARGDGTFSLGIDPRLEAEGVEIFRTAQYAKEFAQEHGWNVVSVIER